MERFLSRFQGFSPVFLMPQQWERVTQVMVTLSIVAFLPLQLPQIWRNAVVLASHDPATIATLQVIPILGYVSGMMANLLLMCYLADRQELGGVIVQSMGIVTSGIVMTQLFTADLIHPTLFVALVLGAAIGMSINFSRCLWPAIATESASTSPSTSSADPSESSTPTAPPPLGAGTPPEVEATVPSLDLDRYWQIWKSSLNILGLALLPVIFTWQLQDSFFPSLSLGIGVAGGGILVGLGTSPCLADRLTALRSPASLAIALDHFFSLIRKYWAVLSGWTANLLFMFGPAAQLINNLLYPEHIAALALPTQVLSVLGNLLILARSGSLWIQGRDRVWAVAGVWEVVLRGGVFLTIAYFGFMAWGWFIAYIVGVTVYSIWIYQNACAQPQPCYDQSPR